MSQRSNQLGVTFIYLSSQKQSAAQLICPALVRRLLHLPIYAWNVRLFIEHNKTFPPSFLGFECNLSGSFRRKSSYANAPIPSPLSMESPTGSSSVLQKRARARQSAHPRTCHRFPSLSLSRYYLPIPNWLVAASGVKFDNWQTGPLGCQLQIANWTWFGRMTLIWRTYVPHGVDSNMNRKSRKINLSSACLPSSNATKRTV